ncbi:MAG: hypothetical protein ABS92_14670 [Thiobacillus sp. SCN 63-374]|nr:MAG: hypothetical protein ABS92_14670 [Thiobacillus sp. SCN 63-374]
MATPLSHLAVPLALSVALGPDIVPPGLMMLALACAVLPDLDALGLWLGIPYDHPFGHRGITHSLPFAVALADVGALLAPALGVDVPIAFWVLLPSAASHGLLDALTNGGLGIALFAPFSNRRVFLPWRVIEVSPLRPSELFSQRGLHVLLSEMRWVWAPCGMLALAGIAVRGLAGPA